MQQFAALFCVLFAACSINLYSQGCSDAGFCSVGSMGLHTSDEPEDSSYMSLGLGVVGGVGDYKVFVLTPKLDFNYRFPNGTQFTSRITFQTVDGALGTVSGFGDVYLTADHPLFDDLHITAGIKAPLGLADARVDNKPMPMDYQSSLGTVDIIAGVTYNLGVLSFSAAAQMPLSQNENTFDPRLYPESSAAQQYHSTFFFERVADVLLRLSHDLKVNDNFSIISSLLPILHVANDTYLDSVGVRKEIIGSTGLTINAVVLLQYKTSDSSSFGITLAAPFITRTARPDGLTRKFIAALEYTTQL